MHLWQVNIWWSFLWHRHHPLFDGDWVSVFYGLPKIGWTGHWQCAQQARIVLEFIRTSSNPILYGRDLADLAWFAWSHTTLARGYSQPVKSSPSSVDYYVPFSRSTSVVKQLGKFDHKKMLLFLQWIILPKLHLFIKQFKHAQRMLTCQYIVMWMKESSVLYISFLNWTYSS